ncbi:sulfite exporter TauE/SafE family protein [Nioella nitratireducens]|uniref:sulfite exporter TauE/SafE family protein n=1 Tax=Nioella nitratireducens TaxID=1287720 RepID=UPI0008FD40EF|nr:sulfite exporter TauE/SafE family protein [Nioella nitratireducens]
MDYWIVAFIAAYLMGLSKGGVPMIAILSVPLMSLFMDPAHAAGLLLPIYIVADMYAVWLFRKDFSVRNLAILLPPAILGIAIAYFTVTLVPVWTMKLLVAAIGIYYLFNAVRKRLSRQEHPARPADVPRGVFWGTLTGITSYIAHAGGPPYQSYVLPQRLSKMTYLGTNAIFFSAVNLLKVLPFILAGQITWDSAGQAVWLAPAALLGAWSGSRITRHLPERAFFLLIEIALAVVSAKLVYEVVTG